MKSLRYAGLALALALGGLALAHAQAAAGAPPAASPSVELADGEVRKIDKNNGKITLKHGPLKNLDMPGMTMAFQAGEPSMLDQVQVGDKVRIQVEKVGGKLTVVRLEAAR